MKKFLLIWMLCLVTYAWGAEPTLFFGEDFANQNVIWVQNQKESKQCQAVRILPKWYLTAAHCVRPACDKECKVTVQLVSGALQAYASVSHTSADKHIFVPTAYHPNTEKAVRHDIALIYFTPDEQDQWYVHTTTGQSLNYKTFIKELNSSSYPEQLNQWQALQQARPALLRVSNMDNRRITVPVAVPDLRQGEIYFKQSQPNDFYYSNQLRYYVGKNFGVGQGMSGSAVVVPGGKIIGIVSMNKQQAGNLVAYNEKDEPVAQIPFSTDYFLFTPISRENASFIQNTIRSMHDSGKTARVERLSDAESEITDKNLQEIIDSFLPVPASVPVAQ